MSAEHCLPKFPEFVYRSDQDSWDSGPEKAFLLYNDEEPEASLQVRSKLVGPYVCPPAVARRRRSIGAGETGERIDLSIVGGEAPIG